MRLLTPAVFPGDDWGKTISSIALGNWQVHFHYGTQRIYYVDVVTGVAFANSQLNYPFRDHDVLAYNTHDVLSGLDVIVQACLGVE